MSLRRPRSHRVGISNIDFRTKRDIENINIFEPWQAPKDLGTMGYKNYRNSQTVFNNLFGPSEKINTYKDLVNDYPDPRFHTTAEFYKKNKILVNTKTFINSERVANLEETFKGKDVFNGDSTNIAEIMRIRKGKNLDNKNIIRNKYKEPFSVEERKIQEEKIKKLAKEKKSLNKNVIHETQLVKINSFIDKGDSMINLKKIEEVRKTLRRKYGNRKKINKIFQLFSSNKIPLPNKKALAIRVKYIFISYGKDKNLELNTLQQYIELLINTLIDNKKIKDIPLSVIDQICEALKFLINSKLLKNNEILLTKLSQSIINKINLSNSFIIFSFLYLIVLSPNTNINNINEIINDNFINVIKKYITSRIDINQTIKILDLLSLSLKKLLYLGQAKFMIGNIINNLYDYLFRIFLDYCTGEKSYVSLVSKYNQNDEEQIKQKAKINLLKSKIFLAIGFMIECDKSINNDNSIQDKKLIDGLIKIIKIILHSFDHIIKEELNNIDENYKDTNYEIII